MPDTPDGLYVVAFRGENGREFRGETGFCLPVAEKLRRQAVKETSSPKIRFYLVRIKG